MELREPVRVHEDEHRANGEENAEIFGEICDGESCSSFNSHDENLRTFVSEDLPPLWDELDDKLPEIMGFGGMGWKSFKRDWYKTIRDKAAKSEGRTDETDGEQTSEIDGGYESWTWIIFISFIVYCTITLLIKAFQFPWLVDGKALIEFVTRFIIFMIVLLVQMYVQLTRLRSVERPVHSLCALLFTCLIINLEMCTGEAQFSLLFGMYIYVQLVVVDNLLSSIVCGALYTMRLMDNRSETLEEDTDSSVIASEQRIFGLISAICFVIFGLFCRVILKRIKLRIWEHVALLLILKTKVMKLADIAHATSSAPFPKYAQEWIKRKNANYWQENIERCVDAEETSHNQREDYKKSDNVPPEVHIPTLRTVLVNSSKAYESFINLIDIFKKRATENGLLARPPRNDTVPIKLLKSIPSRMFGENTAIIAIKPHISLSNSCTFTRNGLLEMFDTIDRFVTCDC